MSYEQAAYFKLLLLCGYRSDLEYFVDCALAEENPLSDITVDLAFCMADNKKILSILNDYLRSVEENVIDYRQVFHMVMSFLRGKYFERNWSVKKTVDFMYRISLLSGKYCDTGWSSLYYMVDYYEDSLRALEGMDSFVQNFELFLKEGVDFSEDGVQQRTRQTGCLNRIRNAFHRKR